MGKHFLSANEYLEDSWRLSAQIRKVGWIPDYLVGLWRGGAPVAIAVHEYLKTCGWNIQHIPMKCGCYTGIGQCGNEVVFSFSDEIFKTLRQGDKVLIVDDVFDTGKTASAIKRKMDEIKAETRIACVYWKPAKNITTLKPDYFVRDLGNEWIVFPHEIEGLTEDEISEKSQILKDLLALD